MNLVAASGLFSIVSSVFVTHGYVLLVFWRPMESEARAPLFFESVQVLNDSGYNVDFMTSILYFGDVARFKVGFGLGGKSEGFLGFENADVGGNGFRRINIFTTDKE